MREFHEEAIAYLKGEMSEEERRRFEQDLATSPDLREELERSREVLDLLEAACEQPVIRIGHTIIQQAIQDGASDIHLVPSRRHGLVVYFRIDGRLREVMRLPGEIHRNLVNRWKVMSDTSLGERRVPQEGHIAVTLEGKDYDLRVTILPTGSGERVTARLLDRSRWVELDDLDLDETQLQGLRQTLRRTSGFLPVVGPVASGKTTLLYGMLRERASEESDPVTIGTVEDPVESYIDTVSPRISQMRVDRRLGLTYAAALRAIARSDFDVVLVGELADRETAELALQMAGSGRLVLAQLPGSGAWGAVQQLRELGVDPFLIAQTLAGAVGRRLVRRICPECATEDTPSPAALRKLGLSEEEDGPFRRGAGCDSCRQTGFQGRVGLLEVWSMEPSGSGGDADRLRQLIADNVPADELWRQSFGHARGSLWDDARRKVRQGLTSVDEAALSLFDYRLPPLETVPTAQPATVAVEMLRLY